MPNVAYSSISAVRGVGGVVVWRAAGETGPS